MNEALTAAEIAFFAATAQGRAALPLYEALRARLLLELPETRIEVKKTQISFKDRRLFAAASLTPVRQRALRPAQWLTVTFGLPYQLISPRVDSAAEAYPGRWTHHVMVGGISELDAELLGWLTEAAAFAAAKR